MLSGPAGGVVGYALTTYNETTGKPVIGFDMGGIARDARLDIFYRQLKYWKISGKLFGKYFDTHFLNDSRGNFEFSLLISVHEVSRKCSHSQQQMLTLTGLFA